jgi:phosphomannomutase/phosphoglucomutase
LYSAVRLLELLGIEDRSSEEVFADFPEDVSTPEINIEVSEDAKFDLVEKLCARAAAFEDGSVSTIDGLRVDFADGWGLCRASNTTPVLVLRFEADNEAALKRIQQRFKDQLLAVDASLNVDF